jgi:hypothetical protein
MFYITSILSAVIQGVCFLALPESYGPTILRCRAGGWSSGSKARDGQSCVGARDSTIGNVLRSAIVRPCRLLITKPIVRVIAIFIAYVYGLMYLALSTFQAVWVEEYGQRPAIASLNYISLAMGFGLATQICAPVNDRVSLAPAMLVPTNALIWQIYANLKAQNGGLGLPEFRVPLMIPGAILVPLGLIWYGWSIQYRLHWIMPNFGAILFGAGVIISMQCCTSYIIDVYTLHAASAVAATTVLRALAGFGMKSILIKRCIMLTFAKAFLYLLRICTCRWDMDGATLYLH